MRSWTHEIESYGPSLFDFDEPSKFIDLGMAYDLGEGVVRNVADLAWCAGAAGTALKMHVATGFDQSMRRRPMLVAENLHPRMCAGEPESSLIEIVFAYLGSERKGR